MRAKQTELVQQPLLTRQFACFVQIPRLECNSRLAANFQNINRWQRLVWHRSFPFGPGPVNADSRNSCGPLVRWRLRLACCSALALMSSGLSFESAPALSKVIPHGL